VLSTLIFPVRRPTINGKDFYLFNLALVAPFSVVKSKSWSKLQCDMYGWSFCSENVQLKANFEVIPMSAVAHPWYFCSDVSQRDVNFKVKRMPAVAGSRNFSTEAGNLEAYLKVIYSARNKPPTRCLIKSYGFKINPFKFIRYNNRALISTVKWASKLFWYRILFLPTHFPLQIKYLTRDVQDVRFPSL
jgi:hypothetical protein